jgi:FkbM family methyltransferase
MRLIKRLKAAIRICIDKNFIEDVGDSELKQILKSLNVDTFVQIGSNDGCKNDPLNTLIKTLGWNGILVEPDPDNFARLLVNYAGQKGLIFENCGVGPIEASLSFFKLKDISGNDPDWYDQIGTFDESTFHKNIAPVDGLESRKFVIEIPVMTFEGLLIKNGYSGVKLLHTDTEGFDFRILMSIDLKKYQFNAILFEAEWMTQYEVKKIISHLRANEYRLYRHGVDLLAVSRG